MWVPHVLLTVVDSTVLKVLVSVPLLLKEHPLERPLIFLMALLFGKKTLFAWDAPRSLFAWWTLFGAVWNALWDAFYVVRTLLFCENHNFSWKKCFVSQKNAISQKKTAFRRFSRKTFGKNRLFPQKVGCIHENSMYAVFADAPQLLFP